MKIVKFVGVACCLFFCELVAAPTAIGPPGFSEPSLSFRVRFSAKDRFPLEGLHLSVIAPDGRTGWQYDAQGEEETRALMKQEALSAENWYGVPGEYKVRVSYSLEGVSNEPRTEEQEFLVTGQELRIVTNLWFIDDDEKRQSLLADLTIRRLLPSSGDIRLIEDWIPTVDGKPRYEIVNDSDRVRYGVAWFGNFFGSVQRDVRGLWIPYPRGGFCGTVSAGKPIEPKQGAGSIEGYFIGDANPFIEGAYRYVVQYSLSSISMGVPAELTKRGMTRKQVEDVYEVAAEFRIQSN
ncbi:MAG TPA: hypothetical protein VKN18_03640 [Blastocatellia bacterium]|nr:hypothetical protein [Blastocatellia bacterium]